MARQGKKKGRREGRKSKIKTEGRKGNGKKTNESREKKEKKGVTEENVHQHGFDGNTGVVGAMFKTDG